MTRHGSNFKIPLINRPESVLVIAADYDLDLDLDSLKYLNVKPDFHLVLPVVIKSYRRCEII